MDIGTIVKVGAKILGSGSKNKKSSDDKDDEFKAREFEFTRLKDHATPFKRKEL